MELSLFDRLQLKKTKTRFSIFVDSLILIYAVIYALYLLVASDITWLTTVLPLLLETLLQILNYLFYWLCFAFVIYAFLSFPTKKALGVLFVYGIAVIVRCVVIFLVKSCILGFSTIDFVIRSELGENLFAILMDGVQIGLVCLFSWLGMRKYRESTPAFLGDERKTPLPVDGFLDHQNIAARLAFYSALIPSAITLLSRLYYDIFFYGAPADLAELLLMVTYYFSDIASVLVGYVAIVMLLNALHLSRLRAERENA